MECAFQILTRRRKSTYSCSIAGDLRLINKSALITALAIAQSLAADSKVEICSSANPDQHEYTTSHVSYEVRKQKTDVISHSGSDEDLRCCAENRKPQNDRKS